MTTDNHQKPTQSHERLNFVDILRGFALIGVLLMNMNAFSGHEFTLTQIPPGIDKVVVFLLQFLLQAKFYSLFSFLFGWGMAFQWERAKTRGTRFIPYYLRRTFLLLIIGLIHAILIWDGDILVMYATLAFILILFRNSKPVTILVFSAACLILSITMTLPGETMDAVRTWYHELTNFLRHGQLNFQLYATGSYQEVLELRIDRFSSMFANFLYWFGSIFSMFLLGFYVGKRGIFNNISEHQSLIRRVMWIGLIVGVVFNGIFLKTNLDPTWVPQAYRRLATSGARTIGAPALMLFYVSAIITLLRKESWRSRLDQLAPVGRMALSNYLMQSILCTLIFYGYGLGLYGEISPTLGLILSSSIYIGQMRFSAFWLERFQFGPVEWAWRSLTYGRRQPFYQGQTYAEMGPSRFGKVINELKKIPSKYILIGVWVILVAWAGGLVLWNQQLISRGYYEPFTIVLRITPTPDGEFTDEPETEEEPTTIITPVVEAVSYNPGPIAASGDMVALATSLDVNAAFRHIEELAGSKYEGRYTGTPGGFAAGEYIAEKFAEYGLQPAGDDGTFFQSFPIFINQLSDVPTLTFQTNDGVQYQPTLYEDYSPITSRYLGTGKAQGPIFWGNECDTDTLQENDLVGKVVFCQGIVSTDDILNKGRLILEYGAAGLLLLTDPDIRPADFGSRYYLPWVPETIPAFRVYPDIVNDILAGTGYTLEDLENSLPPMQLETSAALELETQGEAACPTDGCEARNVLGVIPGRDPAYAHEVVLIGGHYDHMGASPDGTIWYGADDNASGIAVLLEIARSWQELGYVPRRTVLFAAWDAEEIGLLGSSYYVNQPRYPLEDTIGMIQLDMVGAGAEYLSVKGEEGFASQILATAATLGIDAVGSEGGRSDHVPFWQAGVPACLLIWWDESTSYHIHRTNDTPSNIELDQLEAVAQITNLSLLNLTESELAIIAMLEQRELTAEIGDQTAFLATSHRDQITHDVFWLNDLQSLNPIQVAFEVDELIISGNTANAQVHIEIEYSGPAEGESEDESYLKSTTLEVQFDREDEGWLWSGPHLVTTPEDEEIPTFQVYYPPEEEEITGLGRLAMERYGAIAEKLGLPTETDASLYLMPTAEALRTNVAISLPPGKESWIAPGEIHLVYDPEISLSESLETALSQLVLANAGISEDAAPWLWQGLPLVLEAESDPRVVQSVLLPDLAAALEIYPSIITTNFNDADSSGPTVEIQGSTTNPGGDEYLLATSWASVDALYRDYGWLGLGGIIDRFGDSCETSGCSVEEDLDAAYIAALQKTSRGFETSWQNQWKSRLEEIQSDLDLLLISRMEAAQTGEIDEYLLRVDPSIPNLRESEANWVSHLHTYPPGEISISGQPLTIFPDKRVLVSIELNIQHSGHSTQLSYPILVNPTRTGPLWMGAPFKSLHGTSVTVRYPTGSEAAARAVLIEATTTLTEMAAALEISPSRDLVIELFDNPDGFRSSIYYSYPLSNWTRAWTADDENIKIYHPRGADAPDFEGEIPAELSPQIARWLLYQSGIDSEWLLKGVSSLVSRSYDGGVSYQNSGAAYPQVLTKLEEGTLPRLISLSQDHMLSQAEVDEARTLALDSVRYLVETYGWQQLIEFLHSYNSSDDLNTALQVSLGISMREFEEGWRESLARNHIEPEWTKFAEALDIEAALDHIDQLTRHGMNGRQAGTPGDRAAQLYIADQFAEFGLLPAGNPEGTSYFQSFDVTTRIMSVAPTLVFRGTERINLRFREDFSPIRAFSENAVEVSGNLVWVEDYELLEFGDLITDAIVVRPPTTDLDLEIELALDHGAAGIIFAGDAYDDQVYEKQPEIYSYSPDTPIPVFELTRSGTKKLLATSKYPDQILSKFPPFTPFEVFGQMRFRLPSAEALPTANILGYIEGSDPFLKDEIIIIGAHADHVGDDPSYGLEYSGANNDASGISGLLEIARIWQQYDYQPKRSVLFAAWGAQELEQAGSGYYVQNPIYPLENTIGVIQLDGIAGGDGFYPGVQGEWETDGQLLFRITSDDKVIYTPQFTPSDHFSFHDHPIPTLLISWRLADEDNYPDELTNRVNPEKLEICTEMAILALMGAAR